ncbi:MAG: GTPase Era [Candidatus Omnitrophica bacterium]|nr:GTPase Era [Candidatus Omnitrophota bacterium]
MSHSRKTGFVGIIGRPNVGKSTLLNALVGEKLAGISPKPQTTRGVVRGIVSRKAGQIIYLDTPGMHHPKDRLGNWMIGEIQKTIESADLLYFCVTPGQPHASDPEIFEKIKAAGKPVILVVTQVDRYPKPEILPALENYHRQFAFKDLIPVSAKTGDQLRLLMAKTFEFLPEGEPLFEEDQISDQQERFFIQEIIREKIFRMMSKEVPYSTSVVIEQFREEEKITHIHATIIVEKPAQKKIIIGAKGLNIKQIGTAARQDIEQLLGRKVFLQLWVKEMHNWKCDEKVLKELGYQ